MGRIEELRCFNRFLKVKPANISSSFLFVSSNVFFYKREFCTASQKHIFCTYTQNFYRKKIDKYFCIEIEIGIGPF